MTAIGEPAPTFALPDTEGATHHAGRRARDRRGVHLQPLPLRPRLAPPDRRARARLLRPAGVKVLAINPNDAARYPRDSIEAMRARVPAGRVRRAPLPARRDPGGRPRL